MKTEIHDLLVELSDDELKFESSELAKTYNDLEAVKTRKKEVNAELGKEIKGLEREVGLKANIVKTGKAVRPVQCRVEFNTRTETAKIYRIDTGDIVDVREMTREELQQDLFPEHIGED